LDLWAGHCPVCYIRQKLGQDRGQQAHTLAECSDPESQCVRSEVSALESIKLSSYSGCYGCYAPQRLCMRWAPIAGNEGRFELAAASVHCQYAGVITGAVAALCVVRPEDIVEAELYKPMREAGVWGAELELQQEDLSGVKQRMLKGLGQRVEWGLLETSVLVRLFYQLSYRFKGAIATSRAEGGSI